MAKLTGGRPKNILVVGYDPAKASEGGLAALYNGKLIWCGPVLMWDIEEEKDVCAGFENIRDAWMAQDGCDPEKTAAHLFYERSAHGAHFARAAISEAGGAAMPYFKDLLGGSAKLLHPVHPNDWRKIIFSDAKGLKEDALKSLALSFVAKSYGKKNISHNVAEAVCIAHAGHLMLSSPK